MTLPASRLDRRRLLRRLPALAAWPVLPGCGQATPLHVVAHPWIGYETLFLAQQLGWWPDSRQAVLTRTTDTNASQRALQDGSAQAGTLTLDEMLRLRSQGLPLVAVLVFNVSAGADVVLSRAPLAQLADMRGARIGVERGAVGELMLGALLGAAGLQRDDVRVVPLALNQHIAAWHQREIDMLVSYEPHASHLRRLNAHTVFDSRDTPDTIFDVLAVMSDALTRHHDALNQVVTAHFMALKHVREHPQDVIHRIAALQAVTAQDVHTALRGVQLPGPRANNALMSGPTARVLATAQSLSPLMLRLGLLDRAPPLDHLTDTRFIHKAMAATTPL